VVVLHQVDHVKVEVVDVVVVVVVAVVVHNHCVNQQPSLEATAPNFQAASLTAVTTNKLTHALTL
jgi:hypothetical protein